MAALLYLDPVGGIAGDMFMAACLDAGVDETRLREELAKLGPLGFELVVKRDFESTIAGLHVDVNVTRPEPHERSWREIDGMIAASGLSEPTKDVARRIFEAIAKAEAHVHHKPVEEIHFHEVGAVDSIVDVCGAAICLELLGFPRVVCGPPPAGGGTVKSVHGILPVPPPATTELLKGRRVRASGPGERVTPTGAGIVVTVSEEAPGLPDMVIERTGYGVGTMRWADAPNVLRAVLGREVKNHAPADTLVLLETNVDDASAQVVARAIDAALEAGARDAWSAAVTGKKGRPGHVVSALVERDQRAAVEGVLFAELPTLGLRATTVERTVLDREWRAVPTPWGPVRVKLGRRGGKVTVATPEHDECLAVARKNGVPLRRVMQAASAAAERFFDEEE